jgi:hypothetical protein
MANRLYNNQVAPKMPKVKVAPGMPRAAGAPSIVQKAAWPSAFLPGRTQPQRRSMGVRKIKTTMKAEGL